MAVPAARYMLDDEQQSKHDDRLSDDHEGAHGGESWEM